MAGVQARKRQMVDGLIDVHRDRYKASGAELILGEARFVAPKTVEVKKRDGGLHTIAGDQVFLNVGTRATIPDLPGLKASNPMTHVEALNLDRLPKHLVVLGGGFVALELAQAFRRFGSRVTMLVRGPQLASREDADVGEELLRLFHDEGIDVRLNTDVLEVQGESGQELRLRVRDQESERAIVASDILVATGRVANTQSLGLEKTGVELDNRGYTGERTASDHCAGHLGHG